MKKLEHLEKYVRTPDVNFYGVYIYDGEDIELHNETIKDGEYTLEILDTIENGIFKKHKILTSEKGLKEESFAEYPIKKDELLVFIENEGFKKLSSGMIRIKDAIERYKLLLNEEVEDDTKRDEG